MSCGTRYTRLLSLQAASQAEVAAGIQPGTSAAYKHALDRIRAHAEVCQDCIQETKSAWPELAGKELKIISLLPEHNA